MVDFTAQHYDAFAMPMSGVAVDYRSGHLVEPHSHPCVQFIYAIEGVLVIESPTGRWVTPPTRGVWLQAGVEHSLRMRGAARVRSLFVHSDITDGMPRGNCVIDVSPLLRELILAATEIAAPYTSNSRDGRVMRLLLDELCALPTLPFYLPWPADARIKQVCERITAQPQLNCTAEHWAQQLAMSPKTFHRQFQRSTGITFGRWRQQARLLLSLELLAQGLPIIEVALQHGYDSQSAFSAAFKRQFGVPPSLFY